MKSIGISLFQLRRSGPPTREATLERVAAKELGLQESWFRDAIFSEPELVIGACRTGGRVEADEVWLPWRTEVNFGAGPIDVLLVSSHGRIGIVETKLSYNPQKRREVVAQVLDYALSLQDVDREDLPDLPVSPHAPLEEDLLECLRTGRFLLVIAGDALDPRALRLSQSMLAKHLTSEWDLAMVDLNVYRATHDSEHLLVVPELLGTVQTELRQVVRVIVQGESVKARVVVDKIVNDEARPRATTSRVSATEFIDQVARQAPRQVDVARRLLENMQHMAARSHGRMALEFRSATASLYFSGPTGSKRILSLRTDGMLRLLLVYARDAGLDDVVDRLVAAAPPALSLSRTDRAAGIRYTPDKEAVIVDLLARIEQALGPT
jgi:hypothetical protein